MFTGIVQEIGTIRARASAGKAVRFVLDAPRLAASLAVGDSVACDGVCLTVERLEASGSSSSPSSSSSSSTAPGFSVCAVPETLARTTLGGWKPGTAVNLEPALTPSTPLGGHFVLGHVDGVCEVLEARALGDGEGRALTLRLPAEFLRYCVYKGSLTLSGVSLTVAAVDGDSVRIAVIPHTLDATVLGGVKAGDKLNFEVDILAKYVERIAAAQVPRDPSLNDEALRKWGYAVS